MKHGAVGLAVAAVLFTAWSVVSAQTSWTVTVTPSLNPLPVGFCSAVQLTVTDGRDVPRNPAGVRVTIADFDMSVNGASVAGQQIDASHWLVCACQGGEPGSRATISAVYPARALAENARVAGVSIEQTATVTLAAPKGTDNPPACRAGGVAGLTAAARASASPSTPVLNAQARSTFTVSITGTPASATLAWPPVAGVTSYVVTRQQGAVAAAPQTLAASNAGMYDSGLTPGTAYSYSVRAIQADGQVATGTASFTTPPAVNPSGFSASQTGIGQVALSWQPVAGASYYVIFGPGTGGGIKVPGATTYTVTGVPAGAQQWSVGTYYDPGGVSSPAAAFSKASLSVTAPASGRYRVTLTGVRAIKASYDDQLSRDGMGDEIYAAVVVRRYDRQTGAAVELNGRRTPTYGDVKSFPGRFKAGKWSATGGIRDGDAAPDVADPSVRMMNPSDVAFPLRVWEGTLTDGADVLIISPSLWEEDGKPQLYDFWSQQMTALTPSLLVAQEVQAQITSRRFASMIVGTTSLTGTPSASAPSSSPSSSSTSSPQTGATSTGDPFKDAVSAVQGAATSAVTAVGNAAQAVAEKVAAAAKSATVAVAGAVQGLVNGGMDRPIGVLASGPGAFSLPHATIVLTREIIEAGLAPLPAGTVPLALPAAWPRMPRPGVMMTPFLDGPEINTIAQPQPARYELYLTVERLP